MQQITGKEVGYHKGEWGRIGYEMIKLTCNPKIWTQRKLKGFGGLGFLPKLESDERCQLLTRNDPHRYWKRFEECFNQNNDFLSL